MSLWPNDLVLILVSGAGAKASVTNATGASEGSARHSHPACC